MFEDLIKETEKKHKEFVEKEIEFLDSTHRALVFQLGFLNANNVKESLKEDLRISIEVIKNRIMKLKSELESGGDK